MGNSGYNRLCNTKRTTQISNVAFTFSINFVYVIGKFI